MCEIIILNHNSKKDENTIRYTKYCARDYFMLSANQTRCIEIALDPLNALGQQQYVDLAVHEKRELSQYLSHSLKGTSALRIFSRFCWGALLLTSSWFKFYGPHLDSIDGLRMCRWLVQVITCNSLLDHSQAVDRCYL